MFKDSLGNSGERLLNIVGEEGGREQKQNPQIFLDLKGARFMCRGTGSHRYCMIICLRACSVLTSCTKSLKPNELIAF